MSDSDGEGQRHDPVLHTRKSNLREGRDFSADSADKVSDREGPDPLSPQPSSRLRNLTARVEWGAVPYVLGRGLVKRRHVSPRWRPIGDPCRHFPGQERWSDWKVGSSRIRNNGPV